MIKRKIIKIAALAVGMTFVFGVMATPAGAQTTIAELQAQINVLMAQLATLQGGTTSTTACSFTGALTLTSRGVEVTCLQDYLTSTGHFTYAGGSTGYFGPITQAAVAAWQAANGVAPAVGYFGPISQARYTALAGTPGTPTPGTPSTPGAGITTPGVEGTITASANPSPASGTKVYEAGSKVAVLGIKLKAKLSDINVQRVKINLVAGTSGNSAQQFYTKIADRMYVMDGSTVLASVDLNSSTVVKESSLYYITITGFNFIVPKDSTKVLTIAVDPKASWDSTYDTDSWTLTVPVDGVRGVDGANINQRSPSTAFSNSFTSSANTVDSAALAVSLASDSPATALKIADQGTSNNEYDDLVLAKIKFKASDDTVKVTDLVVDIIRGGTTSTATSTTMYIYDGSTLVGSATVAGTSLTAGSATFSDIDWIIPADTTKTLTVKADIDSAAAGATTFAVDIGPTTSVATNVTSENSEGSSITETGSAQGKTITIRNVGPEVTLISKSISTAGVAQTGGTPVSTSTLSATFNLKIKAVGSDILLGTIASGSPVFAKTGANNSFQLNENGVASDENTATSTSYTIPNTCTSNGTNSCLLSDGSEVTVPVTFQIPGRLATGVAVTSALYNVAFGGIQWVAADTSSAVQTTTFMSGESEWKTSDVSFP